MDKPALFDLKDGYACYHPVAQVSVQQAINLISIAIGYARSVDISLLLIDTTGLTGFDPPTTPERFILGGQFARAAQRAVKVAFVARPELIDPNRFGLNVARKRGLVSEVFTAEADALAWLLADADAPS
jgi:hypothetical protein